MGSFEKRLHRLSDKSSNLCNHPVFFMEHTNLKPGGSSILPEETASKFFARHLSAYYFAQPYVREKDILEIGFGDGYGSDFLAQYAKSVKAIDILEKNVQLASGKYNRRNLEFKEMSAVDLDFSDETFDAVVSFQVVEHIEEDKLLKYLGEIKRVLKKGDVAFISTLNLDKNKKPNRLYNKNPYHIKEFTYKEFHQFIGKRFNDYQIYGLFYGLKLRFYERMKKIGIFKTLNNITVNDFAWKEKNLAQCIDFMAMCRKI